MIIRSLLHVYILLVLTHSMDREELRDQSSTDSLSGTNTLIET